MTSLDTPGQPPGNTTSITIACWFVRFALAAAFLSAVGDRFGLWGPPGAEGVAWGSIENYEAYVGMLNWFLPSALISPVGWVATGAEVVIAIGLLVGFQLRWFALAAGLLLTIFATAMMGAFGPKPPLDYSVLSAASAAYLLFAVNFPAKAASVD
ncbi:DoxX family protein [Bremerella sp. JC817]|uniref:DoxX family protein n=1 Tax=Bremerella sp. JC817 TaxID=3231756 RepID=UPI0034583500